MVHSDENIARKLVTEAAKQFDDQHPHDENFNHYLALKLMKGDLRKAILEIVQGRPCSELSELFKELLPWK